MNLSLLLKRLWLAFRELLASPVVLAGLERRNPTCLFYPGAFANAGTTFGRFTVLHRNAVVQNSQIGDHTFVQRNSTVNEATVGKFCSIAANVTIGLGQHPTDRVSTHPAFYSASQPLAKTFSHRDEHTPFRRTFVGNDVWIGQNALIMDGVTIATGAIVAAGAVVTKDVPGYAIVAGIPARTIGYRFNEELRTRLSRSHWWDMPEPWLEQHRNSFSDPVHLLQTLEESRKISI